VEGYGAATYGDRIAGIYDDLYGELFDVDATVATLAELASGRPALELAIGTGRIALPLKGAGVDVSGIDASEEMIARLRSKQGGSDIDVTVGDFADVAVEGSFGLVFIVFNTLFALQKQADQVRCFANVASVLSEGGVFVVEAFVPDLARFDRHQRVSADRVTLDEIHLEVSRHDPVRQTVDSQHVMLREGSIAMYPVSIRYSFPSELDLMAQLAGLRLRHRWGGWHKEPFDSSSLFHVSVYERP
jgi:SAM-dependent methyltransferase